MPKVFNRWHGENEFSLNEFNQFVGGIQWGNWKPQGICLHHTFSPLPADWKGKNPQTGKIPSLDALERFYRDVRGWHSGPHFFVTPDFWYSFTPVTSPGVHAIKFNPTHIGIESVWNGDKDFFSEKLQRILFGGMASLFKKTDKDPRKDLVFHRDDPKAFKTCPGLKVGKSAVITGILNNGFLAKDRPPVQLLRHPEDNEDVPLYLNGSPLTIHGERIDGVTYARLRELSAALGATVNFTHSARGSIIRVTKADLTVDLSNKIEMVEGNAWISVRTFAEALGYSLVWNNQGIFLNKK